LNWLLGRSLERFRGRRWFPVPNKALDRGQRWFGRFGAWSLLLSWLPVGGDALTLVAGVLRVPFWRFVVLVALGKVGRYVVLTLLTLGLA
jgi:membrane protein YqaA with SNARE-associated domain